MTGKPRPNIWWMKDSNLLDNSWILTPQGIVRNELVITRLLRTDHKSILTCQATNSNLTKPVTSSITLELNRELNFLNLWTFYFCANAIFEKSYYTDS
jgi:hypothetical protein